MLVLTHEGGGFEWKSHNLNFSCISKKESQVKSRNDIIYTGFHMQLRSWKLKLQPKIMSYLDKRHVTHYHALSSMIVFSLSLTHTHKHTHTHTQTDITSNADHTADGYLFPFLFFLFKLQCPKHLCWFICTFKTAWLTVIIERTDQMWLTRVHTGWIGQYKQHQQKHSGIDVWNFLSHPVRLPFCTAPPCGH